ncbi:hypothetical protein AAVH_31200 [Aphelenchoides avenae]|nr:hypothetical protein AAVH_31200 [Aphelenchus avenae]
MMRAGGLEAEAEDDYEHAVNPDPPNGAVPANAAQRRAAALANAGQPFAVAQRLVSKKHTDVVVGANGDQWVKHRLSRNGAKQYWRCRDHHICSVRGWSDAGSTDIQRTHPDALHAHDNSPAAQAARNLQDAVRGKALQERDTNVAAVVDSVIRGLPDDVAQRLRRGNLLRVATNAKRGHGAVNVNRPAAEIMFTDAYSTTAAGEEFLLWDSRQTEPNLPPIFIFASATGIQSLRNATDWGSDGTFSVAPPQFDSLYTVHAMRDDHSAVCAAYMLLPDRTGATYLRALRALIREGHLENAAPATIMARNNNKAKVLLRCFGAMVFVHPNDVVDAYDEVVAALRTCVQSGEIDATYDDAIQTFCEYVRNNYVRRLDRHGMWQAPRVADIAQWNCHVAASQGLHRTNNSIEAWNRQFAQLIARAHCAMDKFIYRMQTDEDRSRQALCRQGVHPNEPLRRGRRPQQIATDAALRELVERYDEYRAGRRLLDFMRTALNPTLPATETLQSLLFQHCLTTTMQYHKPCLKDKNKLNSVMHKQHPAMQQLSWPSLAVLKLPLNVSSLRLCGLRLLHHRVAVLQLLHLRVAVLRLLHHPVAVLRLLHRSVRAILRQLLRSLDLQLVVLLKALLTQWRRFRLNSHAVSSSTGVAAQSKNKPLCRALPMK